MHQPLVLEIEPSGQRVELPSGRGHVIGREAGSDVVVPHPTVARRHASFADEEGTWTVEDLGSHCGIAINERRKVSRERFPIFLGDRVRVGAVILIVQGGAPARS